MCEKLLANTVVEDYSVEILSGEQAVKCGVVVFPG